MLLEDDSLECENDKQNNQILLKGLGELHIEVVLSKLRTDHKLNVTLEKMSVVYKESPSGSASHKETIDRLIQNKLRFFELELVIEPLGIEEDDLGDDPDRGARSCEVEIDIWEEDSKIAEDFKQYCLLYNAGELKKNSSLIYQKNNLKKPLVLDYIFHNEIIDSLYDLREIQFDKLLLISQTLADMTSRGPLISSPLVNARVRVTGGRFCPDYLDDVVIRMAVTNCFLKASRKLSISLLEPISRVHIEAAEHVLSAIINEATAKREAKMLMLDNEQEEIKKFADNTRADFIMPLVYTSGYTTFLRSMSSGQIDFSISHHGYGHVSHVKQERILKESAFI